MLLSEEVFLRETVREIKKAILGAKRVFFFTGAGVSTESGLPDYRGGAGSAKTPIWSRREPFDFNTFKRSKDARREYWEFYVDFAKDLRSCSGPNITHRMISSLSTDERQVIVVTQNIDGLHQLAGSNNVIEIHGNCRQVSCINCKPGKLKKLCISDAVKMFESGGVDVMTCEFCRKPLKPNTISFGQEVDKNLIISSRQTAFQSDIVVSMGTTLKVTPAADIPAAAALAEIPYAIVTKGPTDHDTIPFVTWRADCDLCEFWRIWESV